MPIVTEMPKELSDELNKKQKESFVKWKAQPEIALLLKMLDKPDIVEVVVSAAFEAGTHAGLGAAMQMIVGAIISQREEDSRDPKSLN